MCLFMNSQVPPILDLRPPYPFFLSLAHHPFIYSTYPKSSMASETFPFNRLLPEIRLMVWEQTWPEGRVVEVGLYDNQDWEVQSGDEPTEYMALRLSGTISTFLNHDFGSRIIEDPAIEKCLDPIALQICRESRAVTLRHYVRMTHSKLGRSFYLGSSRHLLWLSTDMTDSFGDPLSF